MFGIILTYLIFFVFLFGSNSVVTMGFETRTTIRPDQSQKDYPRASTNLLLRNLGSKPPQEASRFRMKGRSSLEVAFQLFSS